MIRKAYSIFDQKTKVFQVPYFNHSHGEAERNFQDAVNNKESTWHRHPEDFDLYHIGEYDDNSGIMTPLPSPQHLIKAVQLINS